MTLFKDKPHQCPKCGNMIRAYRNGGYDVNRKSSLIMHRECMTEIIHQKKGIGRYRSRYGD